MAHKGSRYYRRLDFIAVFFAIAAVIIQGCGGYSNSPLHNENVSTVYVKMFTSESFRRGIEYELTDALAKRIEMRTPYKIVSDINLADTEISGVIERASGSSLTLDRQTGRTLEREVVLTARVSWKNLRTGELLLDSEHISGSATYSRWQNQGFDYASTVAANNLAKNIVEAMEKPW